MSLFSYQLKPLFYFFFISLSSFLTNATIDRKEKRISFQKLQILIDVSFADVLIDTACADVKCHSKKFSKMKFGKFLLAGRVRNTH